jgi:hypothetical protein
MRGIEYCVPGCMKRWSLAFLFLLCTTFSALAFKVKEAKSKLDALVLTSTELRVMQSVAESDSIRGMLPNTSDMDAFIT